MSLKLKILTLALLPLILVTGIITFVSIKQAQSLSELEIRTFEENLLASKRTELENYLSLALTSISPIMEQHWLKEYEKQEKVKRILHSLTFGADGYFFVYDENGVNLVHPAQPELVGQNLYDLKDNNGLPVVQDLLKMAKDGGGFRRYVWRKPSEDHNEDKLSYVLPIKEWNWMIGTGLYIDDIALEVEKIRQEVQTNIRNTFFTILVIITGAAILIIMIGIAINVHESRLADVRLRALAHKSIRFQVDQRRQFARELHDGINQLMVSVKFRLELAINKIRKADMTAEEDLAKGKDILNQAIQEVRRISHDLRPSLLDDMGLNSALKSLLDEYELRTGMVIQRDCQLPAARFEDDIEITLYRVIQETLMNIEKHANATQVTLKARLERGEVIVTIEDNGCGFDREASRGQSGIGLRNMHDRVELLSGELSINSVPGDGTRLTVKLPLE